MVEVLLIKDVREEDVPLVGGDIVNLARLHHFGLPVDDCLVVLPPEFKLRTVLKKYDFSDREVFEQTLTILKKEILEIGLPDEFIKAFKGRVKDAKKIWLHCLENWLEEIKSGIWNRGLSEGILKDLSAQLINLTPEVLSWVKAWENPDGEVEVKVEGGGVEEKTRLFIEETVKKANKKLFLPQVYYFSITGNRKEDAKIYKLVPFTPIPEELKKNEIFDLPLKENPLNGSSSKPVFKVLADYSTGFTVDRELDGALISGEKVLEDVNGVKDKFEALVFRMAEAAEAYPEKTIIFKLSDKIEQKGGVRGSLRLIHQESLLREEAEAFLFCRNKKKYLNISICVPFTRSVNEFLQIKRDLSVLGISRKGSLKLWLEVSVPENIINLEEYITAGFDGVILNLDELAMLLGGFDLSVPESVFYKKQINALLLFLENALKLLHKNKIPVYGFGSLALDDDVLGFLIEKGASGVISDISSSASLHEHLVFLEKRLVRKRAG